MVLDLCDDLKVTITRIVCETFKMEKNFTDLKKKKGPEGEVSQQEATFDCAG